MCVLKPVKWRSVSIKESSLVSDILTASQGGVSALIGTECYIYIYVPDVHYSASLALHALVCDTWATEGLTGDPSQEWWASLTTEGRWALAALGSIACVLLACCCTLYCCCGYGGRALPSLPRESLRTSSCTLYGEEPRRGGLQGKWRQSGFLTQVSGE